MDNVKILGRIKDDETLIERGLVKIYIETPDYQKLLLSKMKHYTGEKLEIYFNNPDSWTNRMNDLFHKLIHLIKNAGAVQYWDKMGRAPYTFEECKTWVKVVLCGAKVHTVGDMVWVESWKNFGKRRALRAIDSVIDYCLQQDINIDAEKLEQEELRK